MATSAAFTVERAMHRLILVCAALAFATPLVYVPEISYSTIIFKLHAFQALVGVMAAVWAILCVYTTHYRPRIQHPIAIALGLYLFLVGFSTAMSIDPSNSLWSSPLRGTGYVSLLFLGLWTVILSSVVRGWDEWKGLWFATTLVAIGVDLFAIFQWFTASTIVIRVISTFGNPTFLGVYALLHVWIAWMLRARTSASGWRTFYMIAIGLHVFTLMLSVSRGATLALVICLLIATGFAMIKAKHRATRLAGAFGVILVLGAVITTLVLSSEYGSTIRPHLPLFISRFVEADAGGSRLALWQMSWEGFLAHPWFGVGPENFSVIFASSFDPSGAHADVGDLWNDKPHSVPLEILATTGVVGTIGYLLFWIVIGVSVLRMWRKSESESERNTGGLLALLFLSYHIQSLFLFELPFVSVVLFAAVAMLWESSKSPIHPARSKSHPMVGIGVGVVSFCAAILIIALNGLPLLQSYWSSEGYRLVGVDRARAQSAFERALSPIPVYASFTNLRLHDAIVEQQSTFTTDDSRFLSFAGNALKAAADAHPSDFLLVSSAATVHRVNGVYDDASYDTARAFSTQSKLLAPHHSSSYEVAGEVALARREWKLAEEEFSEALARAPEARRGYIRAQRAVAMAWMGDIDRAFEEMLIAESFGLSGLQFTSFIAGVAESLPVGAPNERATSAATQYTTTYENDPVVWSARAVISAKTGDWNSYKIILEALDTLFPEHANQVRLDVSSFAE